MGHGLRVDEGLDLPPEGNSLQVNFSSSRSVPFGANPEGQNIVEAVGDHLLCVDLQVLDLSGRVSSWQTTLRGPPGATGA